MLSKILLLLGLAAVGICITSPKKVQSVYQPLLKVLISVTVRAPLEGRILDHPGGRQRLDCYTRQGSPLYRSLRPWLLRQT